MGTRYWCVIPAAGAGSRVGGAVPKQYLPLAGRNVLQHSFQRIADVAVVSGIVIVIAPGDPVWETSMIENTKLVGTAPGGATRAQSVLSGLKLLEQFAGPGDFVLVHDAARPCVAPADVQRLITETGSSRDGGLLALPVADTVKHENKGCSGGTLQREGLWRAQTPQLFPHHALMRAIDAALADGAAITDEASAMERTGACPRLVTGSRTNIKITTQEDLALAECILTTEIRAAH